MKPQLAAALSVLAITLAGCETKPEWTDWKDISQEQSLVRVIWPPGVEQLEIKREARSERYKYITQERWKWGSGQAFMLKLPGRMFIRIFEHDPKVLIDEIPNWPYLKDMGLSISQSDVIMDVNRIGKYFYAVSDKNTYGQVCFVFHQALPKYTEAGYQDTPGTSGGLIAGYDCGDKGSITVDEMKSLMFPIIEGLQMR